MSSIGRPALFVLLASLIQCFYVLAEEVNQETSDLVRMHDMGVVVAIGNFYLKQETLLAVRATLTNLGRDEKLGSDWMNTNTHWKKAEEMLVGFLMAEYKSEFQNLSWLYGLWGSLVLEKFDEAEVDYLMHHFQSDVGESQISIIDHQIASHVQNSFSLSGKFKFLSGTDDELKVYQRLFSESRNKAGFAIDNTENAAGQAFALSEIGKRYFVMSVLQVVGLINNRLYKLADKAQSKVSRYLVEIDPIIKQFKIQHL